MKQRQQAQSRRGDEHPELAEDEKPAAVDDIRQGSGGKGEQQNGQGACGLNQRHHQRGGRKLRHEPTGSDVLHHRADVGNDRGDPEQAEHFVRQRGKGRGSADGLIRAHGIRRNYGRRRILSLSAGFIHRISRIQQEGSGRRLDGCWNGVIRCVTRLKCVSHRDHRGRKFNHRDHGESAFFLCALRELPQCPLCEMLFHRLWRESRAASLETQRPRDSNYASRRRKRY